MLLDRGSEVELVSRWNALFPTTLTTLDMAHLYSRLLGKGLAYRLNIVGERDRGRRRYASSTSTPGGRDDREVDTVVLATGAKAERRAVPRAQGHVENLHRIGDCVAPRKLDHAIYEGYLAGRELWSPEERYIYEGELERWEEATVGSLT